MERRIELGKVDANENGKKNCLAVLEVEVKNNDNKDIKCFSASMYVYTPNKKDCIMGGQCLDRFLNRGLHNQLSDEKREIFLKVKNWWDMYHLNDLNAGTIEQDKCLQSHEDEREAIGKQLIDTAWAEAQKKGYKNFNDWYRYNSGIDDHYRVSCEILKKYGMYEVEPNTFKPFEKVSENAFKMVDGKKVYRYGCGWIAREIPAEIINEMEKFVFDM